MSGKAVGWVFDWADVDNPTELVLLLAIADASHDDGSGCWYSVEELVQKTRTSERWIRMMVNRLEANGQLLVEHRTGRGRTNFYCLAMRNEHGQMLNESSPHKRGHHVAKKGAPSAPFIQTPKPERVIEGGSKGDLRGIEVLHSDHPLPHGKQADPDPDPDPNEIERTSKGSRARGNSRIALDRGQAIAWAKTQGLESALPRGIDAEIDKFLAHQQGHNWCQPSGLMWADENQAWHKWGLDVLDHNAKQSHDADAIKPGDRDPKTGAIKLAL